MQFNQQYFIAPEFAQLWIIRFFQKFHFSYWWKDKTTNYGKKHEKKQKNPY
jgi:hypothetical protein